MPSKVVLAYSGGLDTSAIIPWLHEKYGCEVIAVVGDVGQESDELEGIEEKAIHSGATQCYVKDLKREFIEELVFPALVAGSMYEGRYLLGTALARPVLAQAQVEIALKTGADAVAHGCTGKGNDQVRFESTYAALAPHLQVIAPWREWSMRSRKELLAYLEARNIQTSASATKIYSRDANLWHISHEGGELEDPWNEPSEQVWTRTVSPEDAPDAPEDVTIAFTNGRPTALNGESLSGVELVTKLNAIAGRHGVGRVDLVESRLVGMKSRGCYETPAGTVLMDAIHSLAEITLDHATMQFRQQIGTQFAELIYNGQWFTTLREVIGASVEKIAERMTGEVVLRLYRGKAMVIRRRSPLSLYAEQYATFGEDDVYDQSHAEGFIRLYTLPSRITATLEEARCP